MAVTQLDSTTTGNTAFASSRAVPVPTGGGALQGDDVVVVRLSRWESTNPAITPPAAGTWVARTQMVNGSSKVNTYLKRLTAADTGTYTFSWSGSMWTTGQATAYRGVDPAADLATIPLHQLTGSGTAWPALTLNSVGAGALDWHGYSENGGTHTVPASFTEVEDNDSDVQGYRIVAAGSYTTSGGTSISSNLIASMLHLPEATGGGSNNTPAGPATEADTAQPATRTRTSAPGQAAETDTAQPAGRTRTSGTTPAAESDQAQPATRTRTSGTTPAAETDTAQPVGSSGGLAAGPAAELDTAQPVGRTRTSDVGRALEVDQGQPAARTRVSAPGTAQETDTAQTAARTRTTDAGPATEIDTAQPIHDPDAVILELLLTGYVEPGRWRVDVEGDRLTGDTEPDRWRTEVEA